MIRSPVVGHPVGRLSGRCVLSVATKRSRAYPAKEAHHHRVRFGVRLRRSGGFRFFSGCGGSFSRFQSRPPLRKFARFPRPPPNPTPSSHSPPPPSPLTPPPRSPPPPPS